MSAQPNALARHYGKFKVTERILLTGHSHQAWPDCSFDGQAQAWLDAAGLVDGKWGRAFEMAQKVADGFAAMMEDSSGLYALAPSTHDLVLRFLSALPLRKRPRIVTTDSEFHSMRRQLQRLQEEGLEVAWVPAHPVASLPERLIEAVNDRTAAVMTSAVFFNSGQRAPELPAVATQCRKVGAELLIDAYHALNVAPFSTEGLESAFVVGGGYKYCQMGEGNCFLRFPRDCALRPIITGWMADFEALEKPGDAAIPVGYGAGGARFAGSTYDPASHYRAAAVFDFFRREGLTPRRLREISQRQIKLLCDGFDGLDLPPSLIDRDRTVPLTQIGGFLSLKTPHAREISEALKARGVFTDYRGTALRLGPAPYLSDEQLSGGIDRLGEITRSLCNAPAV